MTIKFSHRGNNDYELLKFKDLQDFFHQIPKISRPYSVFKDFSGPGKWKLIQGLPSTCGHPANKIHISTKAVTGRI